MYSIKYSSAKCRVVNNKILFLFKPWYLWSDLSVKTFPLYSKQVISQSSTGSRCFQVATSTLPDWEVNAVEWVWLFPSVSYASDAAWQRLAPHGDYGPLRFAPVLQMRFPELLCQSPSKICRWYGPQTSAVSHSPCQSLWDEAVKVCDCFTEFDSGIYFSALPLTIVADPFVWNDIWYLRRLFSFFWGFFPPLEVKKKLYIYRSEIEI